MHIEVVARGFELPDVTRGTIETQIEKLADIGLGLIEATLVLEQRRNQFLAEITLFGRRVSFHAETQVDADTLTAALDIVMDKAERQIRRHKERLDEKRRGRPESGTASLGNAEVSDREATLSAEGNGEYTIVPMPDNFEAKPMSVEEAALQLNLSKNNFIVFRNAQNHDINVLFKKRNGTFGWIYPE